MPMTEAMIPSFRECLNGVALEGKGLRMKEAPPLDEVRDWLQGSDARAVAAYVAMQSGEVIGWADVVYPVKENLRPSGRLGMGVDAAWRRQGIGRQLLNRVLRAAEELKLYRVELEVFDANHAAIALYESAGFSECSRKEGLVRMTLQLSG